GRMLTFTLLASAAPEPADVNTVSIDRLNPPQTLHLRGDVFHVQGLDTDGDFVYVTSVDTGSRRGFLHKFDNRGALVAVADLTDGRRYHPGGISMDGNFIWVP